MDNNNEAFTQDLSGEEHNGAVFGMQLFMREQCPMPDKELMTSVMQKHLGAVLNYSYDDGFAGFSALEYKTRFNGKEIPPSLLITKCCEAKPETIDAFTRSQMWSCPDHDRVLSECRYQVVATDLLGAALSASDRADMIMNFLEALVELYPTCEAVYFMTSGKMFMAEDIRSHNIPRESRFIYFAVNVRFFKIQGTDDMLVDTLGMSTLHLPDLQYHFHSLDPNPIVNHAYNMLSYIFENDCPIKSGDTIDGIDNGEMTMDVQWGCHYEESMVQPKREVIDICAGRFASGDREY